MHIIQHQIQGFTQEEGSLDKILCSSENEEEYLSSTMKYLSSDDKSVQTDYVLADVALSSKDDDEKEDDIQITVTTIDLGGGLITIFALNSSLNFN